MTTERVFTIPTVGDRMAVEPIVIRADATLTSAAAVMDRHHIHGLPVVDPSGSLVGVLSQRDLYRAAASSLLQLCTTTHRESGSRTCPCGPS